MIIYTHPIVVDPKSFGSYIHTHTRTHTHTHTNVLTHTLTHTHTLVYSFNAVGI